MNLITIVEPPVEPITLEDCYAFLRLDPMGSPPTHPDDAMLQTMITTARTRAEQITRRAFVQQTIRMVTSGFPCRNFGGFGPWGDGDSWIERDGWMELLRPPFLEMVAVRYYDEENALQTVDAAGYFVSADGFLPRLMLSSGSSWPSAYRRDDALQVEYVVGYAPNSSPPDDYRANVPAPIKDAIKIGVQLLYDELAPEKRDQLEEAFQRLLSSFRVYKF